jgi:hypothetical protein
MAWQELFDSRGRKSRIYRDDINPLLHQGSFTHATLHYESALDSGVYDTTTDMTPVRINNAQLDGWRVTANGWHYALGQPGGKTNDGWVGFGGRQGAHWLLFRLRRVGYLHWPTRAWDDVGGAPDYDRANLTSVAESTTIGPNDDAVTVESRAAWESIWTTPGGGQLDVSWKARGDDLKEEITVNEMARNWIAANRPPTTPAAETYFGFVIQLDWSDIPRIYRQGLQVSPDDDFADDGALIELRDAAERFLAFLPLGDVRSGDIKVLGGHSIEPIRKRFWLDGDGNHYMLIGVRADILNGMAAGDLVFDPTVNLVINATNEDARDIFDGTVAFSNAIFGWGSWWSPGGASWDTPSGPGQGVTIDSAVISVRFQDNTDWGTVTVYGEDEDDGQDFTSALASLTQTTASVSWVWSTHGTVDYVALASVATIVQEIVNRGGWSAGNRMTFQLADEDQGSAVTQCYDYSDSASWGAKLDITWTAAGGDSIPYLTNISKRRFRPLIVR